MARGKYKGAGMVEAARLSNTLEESTQLCLRSAIGSAVEQSTSNCKITAQRAWERFCIDLKLNPSFLDPSNQTLADIPAEDFLAGFIAYEMYRGMNPESIRKAYLPGIAANFDSNRINNNFRKTISSPWVKNVVKGFAKIYFKRPGNSKGDNRRMAFTGEFIPHIIDAMDTLFGKNRCSVDMKNMELLAVRIGIWFVLRKSEYLPNGKSNLGYSKFGIALSCIIFTDVRGTAIRYEELTLETVYHGSLKIGFSKTDQFGIGRTRTIKRDRQPGACCIVTALVIQVIYLRDKLKAKVDRDFLFAVNGEALVHADHVTIIIKTTVIHCGMDASKYTPHSLRYGGATLLALNGVPIHLIEYHGGWARNSSSLRLYLHIHIGDNEDVVANAMAACERNSLKEVRLRHFLNQR